MKKRTILSIAIALAAGQSNFAARQNIHDITEDWTKNRTDANANNTGETTGDNLRIGVPTTTPAVPVGEGILLLSIAAGGYGATCKRKR
ncbi:MAG: hypothetical protein LBH19_11215 [Dysgonamonadaceae bacterium]|jgi:hypothetical protein|nr:hypothetical protein [Dysgonamonadaceae bacterium]